MERFNPYETGISKEARLEAFLLGIKKANKDRLDKVNEVIVEFVEELKKTVPEDAFTHSASYHLLIGSTMQHEASNPDPLFDAIETFVQTTLSHV